MRELVCPVCGKEFKATHWAQKYCSPECSSIAQKEYRKNYKAHKTQSFMRELVCPVCGKEFSTNQIFRKYCSDKCSKIAQKETLNNYRKTHKEQISKYQKEYNKDYYKTHKKQFAEYFKKHRRKCKELGVARLSDLHDIPVECPHHSDCFNCPEQDCILDYGEI